jgi:threonine/homoserine/homoserine lactone efflux protein
MPNLPAFVAYVLVTTFTPGPNNIMSMTNASRLGFKKALPFAVGVGAGFVVILMLAALFSGLLYSAIPSIKPYMLAVGALYMLYLAYKTLKSAWHPHEEEINGRTGFLWGALLQFVNPKGVLYSITVMSAYILPYWQAPLTLALISIALGVVCIASTVCWALFGSAFKALFSAHAKAVGVVMALLLVYCAVSLFI